jgi:hypothetical protein
MMKKHRSIKMRKRWNEDETWGWSETERIAES